MSRRIIGPFNRVEGDLEVQLEMNDGQVAGARVVSPLYRGFEQILQGKDPMDALVYVPRICGICSVAQSVASAQALAQSMGLSVPHTGELATNLILACENAADHLTHFYLFFMPDFAREVYASEPWYQPVAERFKAVKGTAARDLLPARAQFMHLMGLLAGKWPHSLALQPGGTTRAVEVQEKTRIKVILYGFRQFLEQALYGDSIENVTGLDSIAALDNWRASHAPTVVEDSKGRTIMLHTSNWQFAPNTIRLKKDENVSLHLMGIQGNHGISIPGLGVNEAMGKGSAKLVKVPTDKAGTFPFHCNVSCGPGHADMEGTIIIE